MSKIRFGLVGCGRISQKHFDAILSFPDQAELVAVCDVEENKTKDPAQKYNCKAYTDYGQMLEEASLDAVVICTPSGLHPAQAMIAAKKNVHVVTEKPMSTDWNQAYELMNFCQKQNVQLHVVHQNRLNATVQLLKKAVDKNRFGKIYDFQVNVFWTRPQEYYDAAKWRGTWELDGGALMNQASHYIDMIQYILGDVKRVAAMTKTLARNIEAEDTGVVVLETCSGALGTLNVTMLTYPKNLEGSITVFGEKGTVKLGGVALNKIEEWTFANYDDDDRLVENSSYETASIYGFGHQGYYENVLKSLSGKIDPQVCGLEGLKSLELILAIYKSSQTQNFVELPLFERKS